MSEIDVDAIIAAAMQGRGDVTVQSSHLSETLIVQSEASTGAITQAGNLSMHGGDHGRRIGVQIDTSTETHWTQVNAPQNTELNGTFIGDRPVETAGELAGQVGTSGNFWNGVKGAIKAGGKLITG